MPSRRNVLAGIAAGFGSMAGCLGAEHDVARCASSGAGESSQHLRRVAPITGDEQVSLGVLVSERVPSQERFHVIDVRNRDGNLVASIPLDDNRAMSSLDPDAYPVFGSDEGELYAVPLGQPPVHGVFTVSLLDPENNQIATTRLQFNCYAGDGGLP